MCRRLLSLLEVDQLSTFIVVIVIVSAFPQGSYVVLYMFFWFSSRKLVRGGCFFCFFWCFSIVFVCSYEVSFSFFEFSFSF